MVYIFAGQTSNSTTFSHQIHIFHCSGLRLGINRPGFHVIFFYFFFSAKLPYKIVSLFWSLRIYLPRFMFSLCNSISLLLTSYLKVCTKVPAWQSFEHASNRKWNKVNDFFLCGLIGHSYNSNYISQNSDKLGNLSWKEICSRIIIRFWFA